jgi:hypothetical protein
VTTFPLVKPYRPELFAKVVPELDRVAKQLAAQEHATITNPRTITIAGRKARAYDVVHPSGPEERIVFVLSGPREYQLYCRNAGDVCDRLFGSFRLR